MEAPIGSRAAHLAGKPAGGGSEDREWAVTFLQTQIERLQTENEKVSAQMEADYKRYREDLDRLREEKQDLRAQIAELNAEKRDHAMQLQLQSMEHRFELHKSQKQTGFERALDLMLPRIDAVASHLLPPGEPYAEARPTDHPEPEPDVTPEQANLANYLTDAFCRAIGGHIPADHLSDYAAELTAIIDQQQEAGVRLTSALWMDILKITVEWAEEQGVDHKQVAQAIHPILALVPRGEMVQKLSAETILSFLPKAFPQNAREYLGTAIEALQAEAA